MKLQTRLAVLVCKASGAVLRKLGRGGTNLPGKLALKIDKNILGELSRGVKVTVVTGTNGKTTTSRMIEQAFADAGLKYFSNKSGANLLTGIIAVFAQHSTLSGKCPYTHALIECDEAAFRKTSEYLPVECLVVNNIFRDQLDRYGEITHTLNAIREGITHVPNATLCLNADCSLTASLADSVPNKIVWFGVNVPIYKETAHELSDAPYCIHCKTEYEYDYITYGHLGGFRCPKCGYHRQTPQVAVTKVLATGADSSDISTGHLRSRARGTRQPAGRLQHLQRRRRSRCRARCRHRRADCRQCTFTVRMRLRPCRAVQARSGTGAHDAGQESCRLQSGHQPDRAR